MSEPTFEYKLYNERRHSARLARRIHQQRKTIRKLQLRINENYEACDTCEGKGRITIFDPRVIGNCPHCDGYGSVLKRKE